MAQLPEPTIEKFQALWLQHYRENLSHDQAVVRAQKVLAVVKLVLQQQSSANNKVSQGGSEVASPVGLSAETLTGPHAESGTAPRDTIT